MELINEPKYNFVKAEKVTIAHISDLHRSKEHPISNMSLLDSLVQDMDCYTTIGTCNQPDILIVSGDIVHGSKNPEKAAEIIKSQYAEALLFLNDLTNKLFNGDKSRVILIPGNHDVSWTESSQSMERIDEKQIIDEKGGLKKQIFKEAIKIDSSIKWSWVDRSFYKVNDTDLYNKRLIYFAEFYAAFYGDRIYSLEPKEQFEIFDFPNYGITIVGFNSCFQNDHFNRAGSINPDCIADVGLKIRKLKKQNRLFLATWHHNFRGGPYDQDYMDDIVLESLIAKDFKIGFHGHQHKQQIIRIENTIVEDKKMHVFSAGSLCAGPDEIPAGYNRQYNLVELNRVDDRTLNIRALSRVKTAASSNYNPVWTAGAFDSSLMTEFIRTINHESTPILALTEIEKLIGDKKFADAIKELKTHDLSDSIVRKLLLHCYTELGDDENLLLDFINPETDEEAVHVLSACINYGNSSQKEELLDVRLIKNSSNPSVLEIKNKLIALGK